MVKVEPRQFGDRFELAAEVGHGGMGVVYRALDALTGQEVALKVLAPEATARRDRFDQEAAMLAELVHPSIVRYVDHGQTPAGDAYLAMEWLAGETLEERLGAGPLCLRDVLSLGQRVLQGLDFAHRRSIVHRDLKPGNLFLVGADAAQVKLLDFGVARRFQAGERLTQVGATVGTPLYMSPEQARGDANIDGRADIFALGCVLYECLTGAPPFSGETVVAVLAKICVDEPVSVAEACPYLPPEASALLERMLIKDRSRRESDPAVLAHAFGELLATIDTASGRRIPDAAPAGRAPLSVLATVEQRVLTAVLVAHPRGAASSTGESELPVGGLASAVPSVDTLRDDPPADPAAPGSTSSETPPDEIARVGMDRIRKELGAYNVSIERMLDGALVVTLNGAGAPTDQAVRAARCALQLRGLFPRAAIAVNIGRALVHNKAAFGDVIDGAARLLADESPGRIRLDPSTASLLTSRFELSEGEPTHLLFEKGLREAPRTVLGRETTCVGRDREIANLVALWDECVAEPAARAVIVSAPAGGGKSRVRHEFLERVHQQGERVELLIGRGDSISAGAPFALLAPAIRAAAGIHGGEPLEVRQKRFAKHVTRHLKPVPSPVSPGPHPAGVAAPKGNPPAGVATPTGNPPAGVAAPTGLPSSPFTPSPELLPAARGPTRGQGPVVSPIAPHADARRRIASFIGEMVGIHFPDDDYPPLRAARQDARLMADQMLTAWLDWQEAETAVQPVLLVLEDLHWGDVPSVEFVDAALRTLKDRPFMVIALGRPEIDQQFPNIWKDRDPQRINLPPLGKKAAEKLVRQVMKEATDEQLAWALDRADGNPFFLEELLRALVGTPRGAVAGGSTKIDETGERLAFAGAHGVRELALPDTVIGMVQARLDTFGAEAKRILRGASVFGQFFRRAGLAAVLADAPARAIDEWLDVLTVREVITPRQGGAGGGSAGGGAGAKEYVFNHALIRDAAYEMLTDGDKKIGHGLAGAWLESVGEPDASVLVEHFERALENEKAARWSVASAEQALEANDLSAAVERAQKGQRLGATDNTLGLLKTIQAQGHFWRGEHKLAEAAARHASCETTGNDRLAALSELVAAFGQQSRFDDIESIVRSTDRDSTCEASQILLLRAADWLLDGGRERTAEDLVRDWNQEPHMSSPDVVARFHVIRASLARTRGHPVESAKFFKRALDSFTAAGNQRQACIALANVGAGLLDLGDLDGAVAALEDALVLAQRVNLRDVAFGTLLNLLQTQTRRGKLTAASEIRERVRSMMRPADPARYVGGFHLYSAFLALCEGMNDAALEHATEAVSALAQIPTLQPLAKAIVARVHLSRGELSNALEVAQEANAQVERHGADDGESFVRLTLIDCLEAAGSLADARIALRRARCRLEERTGRIEDSALKQAFTTHIRENSETMRRAALYGE